MTSAKNFLLQEVTKRAMKMNASIGAALAIHGVANAS
jgi:hypothetical protein